MDWKEWTDSMATMFTRHHSLDFFLWGYIKNIVYRTKVWDMTDLKQRISNAIATFDEAMLQQIWQEIECLLDALRATNDAHIEVY